MTPASEELRQLAAEVKEDCARRLQEDADRENSERRAEHAASAGRLLDSRGLMLQPPPRGVRSPGGSHPVARPPTGANGAAGNAAEPNSGPVIHARPSAGERTIRCANSAASSSAWPC
jgi:hypothetical protein